MSTLVKFACMLMLASSAVAASDAFTDKEIASMASPGTVAVANATVSVPKIPENRTPVLIFGIAAVAVTFHRVIFRGRQAA